MSETHGKRVDTDLVDAYLVALRSALAAPCQDQREAAEKKAASMWFVMDIATQNAALVEAARHGLLEPRVDRHGLTLHPVVRHDKLIWVTIPDRE